MHPLMITSITTICLVFVAAAVSTTHALSKPGGDFTSGNPAVAADVNSQFNTLYTALNSGANSINIDSWANAGGNLGYTGGRLGIGIGVPTAKLTLSQAGGTNADGMRIINGATTHYLYSDAGGRLTFGSASTPTAMVIQDNGLIGLGTASPTVKLHVLGSFSNSDGTNLTSIRTTGAMVLDNGTQAMSIDTNEINASGALWLNWDNTNGVYLGGNVGIGTSSPGQKLHVAGNINLNGSNALMWNNSAGTSIECFSGGSCQFESNGHMDHKTGAGSFHRFHASDGDLVFRVAESGIVTFYDGSGGAQCTINNGVQNCTSDERLKNNIKTLHGSLSRLSALRGVSFSSKNSGEKRLGVIAQEVQGAFPELVSLNEDGYLMVQHTGLFGPMIQAINELKSEKDKQVIALEKRAAVAETRAAKFEKLLADEQLARKQQEIRLAQLEANLQRVAKRLDGQVVARK